MAEAKERKACPAKSLPVQVGTELRAGNTKFDRKIYDRLEASRKAFAESRPENSILVGRIPNRG